MVGDVIEPREIPVSTVGGAKRQHSNSIFSVTARDINAVLSLSCAPFYPLQGSPKNWGRCPLIWGSYPKNENLCHVTLRFFGLLNLLANFSVDRGRRPLMTPKCW